MGKVISKIVRRPVKNWNVENRAVKALEKQEADPVAKVAPRHATTQKLYDDFSREHPELLAAQKEKNENLHTMLKGMVVNPDKVGEIHSRPLPTNKQMVDDLEFGYLEPDRIPEGKCSIREAIDFISSHQTSPEVVTAESIATEYKLDPGQVSRILEYFQAFHMHFPEGSKAHKLLKEREAEMPTKQHQSLPKTETRSIDGEPATEKPS